MVAQFIKSTGADQIDRAIQGFTFRDPAFARQIVLGRSFGKVIYEVSLLGKKWAAGLRTGPGLHGYVRFLQRTG